MITKLSNAQNVQEVLALMLLLKVANSVLLVRLIGIKEPFGVKSALVIQFGMRIRRYAMKFNVLNSFLSIILKLKNAKDAQLLMYMIK